MLLTAANDNTRRVLWLPLFPFPLAVLALIGLALSACSTADSGLKDVGSLSGGFAANADPNGTNRRPDVYGGFTRPTLPTIGNR